MAVKSWVRFLGIAALSLLLCLAAFAQPSEVRSPQTPAGAPLFWADGITQTSDLDAYGALGFNAVVVRLTWRARPDGEISAADLAPQRAFADAAAARGLRVIYALPAAPQGLESAFRLSADSEAYTALWTAWLQQAVASLRGTPGLIGWMLPDDPRGLPIFDDIGFRRWLRGNYADVGVINRQWSAKFDAMDDIGLSDVAQLSNNWRAGALPESEARAPDGTRRQSNLSWAFHPAALALAHYKWDAYRALLATWVGALRGEDATHTIFSGRTPDYAQLLSLPAGIDVAVPDMAPGVAEDDIVTHNPQSLDIARRGGQFGVCPVFSPRTSPEVPAGALADLTKRWMEEACARGAKGVGFTSWNELRAASGLTKAVGDEISRLSAPAYASSWGAAPINTTAVLLTPLADGQMVQMGTPPAQAPRGLYGFGDDLVSGEPSNLVWMLRWGTAFGGVDYLSPDDLGSVALERYSTLLAPQALSADNEESARLTDYVADGGALVADLGMGAMQNGGQVNALPPPLASLFGIGGTFDVRPLSFNLNGVTAHPLLPSWGSQIGVRPGLSLTLGDGPNDVAFSGPTGLSLVLPSATILATGPRLGQDFGPIKRILSTQLTLTNVGRGYALFAPFRLWNNWKPGQTGFDTFFGDLMGRGATTALAGASSLVPSPVTATLGTTMFPEVVNRATGVTLTNHNAPGAGQLATLQTSGAGDWLWSGGLALLTPGADYPTVGGRTAPVENPSEFEARARPVTLYATLPSGEARPLSMRPIAAQNLSGGSIAAQISEESARRLRLNLWPGSPAIVAAGDEWQPTIAPAAPVRLTIVSSSDGYLAAPGTRHRLQIVDYAKTLPKGRFATTQQLAVADATGRLTFEFSGAACALEIVPAP